MVEDSAIGGVLSSNMETLNRKRTDLMNQSKVLNEKISKKEEKQSYLVNRKNELESRERDLHRKYFCSSALINLSNYLSAIIENIQKLMLIREEFDKFIETTENSQNKIDESVATLLYVVKKESDSIIRKKTAINSQM